MEHICAACRRPRSLSYQVRHPLVPGKVPRPGVCSRCVRRFLEEPRQDISSPSTWHGELSQPRQEVHHYVHHYYHCQCGSEERTAPLEAPAPRVELASESSHRPSFMGIKERSPPPVYAWTKPVASHIF